MYVSLVVKVVVKPPSADWVPDQDHLEPPIKPAHACSFRRRATAVEHHEVSLGKQAEIVKRRQSW